MINILEKLDVFNDNCFTFDSEEHQYRYNSEKLTSVTKYLERFHHPFDKDYWATKIAGREGIETEDVITRWDDINNTSKVLGTAIHNWIENYYNKVWQCLPNDPSLVERINKFNMIYATHLHKLVPVKFEQKIFSKKYKLAGTIDAIFLYNDNIFLLDWKTNKNFTSSENPPKYNIKLKEPFEQYDKTHHVEYSIQLSLYKLILAEWDIDVKGGYLVHIPHNNDAAKIYNVFDFSDILSNYLLNDKNLLYEN